MVEVGNMVGGYCLTRKMNQKKNPQVFSANLPSTNEFVAIKIFEGDLHLAKNHLLHEAEILKKIHHPHVVSLIDIGQTESLTYLVTEFLEGVPLNRIIPKNTGLSFKTLWPLINQIAEGLNAIHKARIVHTDLKPSNILLSHQENGEPLIKIIDFDIAQDLASESSLAPEKPWGTPGYLAPELILKKSSIDTRADLYSFGLLLTFLLTGKQPYQGETTEEILSKQLKSPPDTLNDGFLKNSPELQKIIKKAIQVNPENRFQNIKAMMSELRSFSQLT